MKRKLKFVIGVVIVLGVLLGCENVILPTTPTEEPTITVIPTQTSMATPTQIASADGEIGYVYTELPNLHRRICPEGVASPLEQCELLYNDQGIPYITPDFWFPVFDGFEGAQGHLWLCLNDRTTGHNCEVVVNFCYGETQNSVFILNDMDEELTCEEFNDELERIANAGLE